MSSTVKIFKSAIHTDLRGEHIKFFGATPEKIEVPGFEVKEVYMTLNKRNTLRGMHFQVNPAQPKILTCLQGEALVNVVNLDQASSEFLKVTTLHLQGHDSTEERGVMILVPEKHALGYRSLQEGTLMLYIAGADFTPEGDVGLDPFDQELNLFWGENFTKEDALLSPRDLSLPSLEDYRKAQQ